VAGHPVILRMEEMFFQKFRYPVVVGAAALPVKSLNPLFHGHLFIIHAIPPSGCLPHRIKPFWNGSPATPHIKRGSPNPTACPPPASGGKEPKAPARPRRNGAGRCPQTTRCPSRPARSGSPAGSTGGDHRS